MYLHNSLELVDLERSSANKIVICLDGGVEARMDIQSVALLRMLAIVSHESGKERVIYFLLASRKGKAVETLERCSPREASLSLSIVSYY